MIHGQSCCFAYKAYCFFWSSRCRLRRWILKSLITDLTSTPHRPFIDPTSTPHRPDIDPTSTLHLPSIDPHLQSQDQIKGPSFVILSLLASSSVYVSLAKFSRRPRHSYTTGTTVAFYAVSWSLAVQVTTSWILTKHYITKAIVVQSKSWTLIFQFVTLLFFLTQLMSRIFQYLLFLS